MQYPADRQQSRIIRQSLYALKRQYGGRVDVYRQLSAETDLQTGEKKRVVKSYPIRRVVVLPAQLQRDLIQTISHISANKKMVQGGTIDRGQRNFLIDARDLPAGFDFTNDDWLVFRDRRYELKQIYEFEFQSGWLVQGREVRGPRPEQQHHVKADDLLSLDDIGTV